MDYLGDGISSVTLLDSFAFLQFSGCYLSVKDVFFRCAVCLLKQCDGGVPALESIAVRRE